MMLSIQRVSFPLSTTTTTIRRNFFNLADSIRNASIKRYNEKKILNFTQQQIYEVVSNVDEYHRFIPFCNHSRVYSNISKGQNKHVMQAELGIGFKLFEEKYMSTVTCHQPHKVQAISSDASLFKELVTTWQFHPHTANSCRVDFDISFEFASPLHAQASNVFFDQVSQMMMKAFIDRCHQVYPTKTTLL